MTVVTIGAPSVKARPAWLTSNGVRRMNHYEHARYVRAWLNVAMWQIRADRVKPVTAPVRIDVYVQRTSPRRIDADGVAPTAKVCIDALVRCGVIPDDGPKFVRTVAYHAEQSRASADWLRLVVEPVEQEVAS